MNNAMKQAIDAAGGVVALATMLGSNIRHQPVGAHPDYHVLRIEERLRLSCELQRPDIYPPEKANGKVARRVGKARPIRTDKGSLLWSRPSSKQIDEKKISSSEARLHISVARAILDTLKVEMAAAHLTQQSIPSVPILTGGGVDPARARAMMKRPINETR